MKNWRKQHTLLDNNLVVAIYYEQFIVLSKLSIARIIVSTTHESTTSLCTDIDNIKLNVVLLTKINCLSSSHV